jgi:hypothetical protein
VRKLGAKDCINYKKHLIGDDFPSFSKKILAIRGYKLNGCLEKKNMDLKEI